MDKIAMTEPMPHETLKENYATSGCQFFVGEDNQVAERKMKQKKQMKEWLDQQIKEKQEKKALDKYTDKKFAAQTKWVNTTDNKMESTHYEKRRDMAKAMARENNQISKERADTKKREADDEQMRNYREINYSLNTYNQETDPLEFEVYKEAQGMTKTKLFIQYI